jgi:hypothetical protein
LGEVEYYRDGFLAYVSTATVDTYYPLYASCKAFSYQALVSSAYFVSSLIPTVGYATPSNGSAIRFTAYDPTAFAFTVSGTNVSRLGTAGFRSISASDVIITSSLLTGVGAVNGMDFVVPSNALNCFVGLARVIDDSVDSYSSASMTNISKVLYGMYLDPNRRIAVRDVMGMGYVGGYSASDRLGLHFVNGAIMYLRNGQVIATSQPVNVANFPLVLRVVLYNSQLNNVTWVNDALASSRTSFTQSPGEAIVWTGYDATTKVTLSPNNGVVTPAAAGANLVSAMSITGFNSVIKGVEFSKDSCAARLDIGFAVMSGDTGATLPTFDFGFVLNSDNWVSVKDGGFAITAIRLYDDNSVFRLMLNPTTQHVEYYKNSELIHTSRQALPANTFPMTLTAYFNSTSAIRNVKWLGMSDFNVTALTALSPVKWFGAGQATTVIGTYYSFNNNISSVNRTTKYNNVNRLGVVSRDVLTLANQTANLTTTVRGFRFRVMTTNQFQVGLVPTHRDRLYWNDEGEMAAAFHFVSATTVYIIDNFLKIRGATFVNFDVNDLFEIRFNAQNYVEYVRNGRVLHVSGQAYALNSAFFAQVTTWDWIGPVLNATEWISPTQFGQPASVNVGQLMQFVNYNTSRIVAIKSNSTLTRIVDSSLKTAYAEYAIHWASSVVKGFSFIVTRSTGLIGLGFSNMYSQQFSYWLTVNARAVSEYEQTNASYPVGAWRDGDVFKVFINREGRFVAKRNDRLLYISRNTHNIKKSNTKTHQYIAA